MPIETEVNIPLPSQLVKERLSRDTAVVSSQMGDYTRLDMVAQYYDSPAHELMELKSTLRRRVENGVPYVTFKQAAESAGRLLTRMTWECAEDDVSAAIGTLTDMGAPRELLEIAERAGFLPRGVFEYTRQSVPLMLADGTSVEMNFDEGVIRAAEKQSDFMDVSFKLLFGRPSGLESFVLILEEKYGLVRGMSGKYERALRLIRSRS